MYSRQSVSEIFSAFLYFENDRVGGWATDSSLQRSMRSRLALVGDRQTSPKFWALYWYRVWCHESSAIAKNHLAAYLQETCYWAAQKLAINVSSRQSIADFFQVAIVKVDRILHGYNSQAGTELSNYASLAFTNAIKDTLRQRQEVEICTDWALLHKVSHKRLREALQNLGLNPAQIDPHLLAWQCFKTIYAPTVDTGASRKLAPPEPAIADRIAELYNAERVHQIATLPQAGDRALVTHWLTTAAAAVRTYLYPTTISASQPSCDREHGEFLDNFESTFQDSLLTQAIELESASERAAERAQLQQVLLKALIKVDIHSQRLLQMYYGRGLTQREIATELMTKQYTVSRRLNRVRQALLTALSEWSQATLHQSLATNVINDLSIAIEEWLRAHYQTPVPPAS